MISQNGSPTPSPTPSQPQPAPPELHAEISAPLAGRFRRLDLPAESEVLRIEARGPLPPSDEEKYSYFGKQPRWPFVWLFVSQLCIVYGYVMVMKRSPDTALGLIFLTFMVPPIFVNLWLRTRRRRVTLEDHQEKIAAWAAGRMSWPSVDVFIPCCGEELEVLSNTFLHVSRLEWGGRLHVQVLDDADQPAVKALAESFDFTYVVRPNRGEWKKAGNLIHAFDNSSGEFITVFDADFAPRADFLFDALPYMDDPRTGVVQTAQYFSTDGVNYISRYAGSLQELFFRWIQPARDTCEAAICAGTNVVYRRAAVVAAGGFAKVPLGEDVHSGVKIWVANYRTRYLPLVLAKGLAPDSWSSLTNQQYRWCRSSMLLMVSGFFKDAPFSRRQRICFWAAFLYYMASAALVVTSALPTLIMVWFYPEDVHWWNYLPLLPSLVSTFVIFPRLARGWSYGIYRVCTINSFCHVLAVFDALRQHVQAWVPTGATKTAKKANVPRTIALMLRTWLICVQALLWVGIARAVTVHEPNPWSYAPAVALALVQLYMLAPFLFRLEPKEQAVPSWLPAAVPIAEPVEVAA